MTAHTLDIVELEKELSAHNIPLGLFSSRSEKKVASLSGKELAHRLAGLLTDEQADELAAHISDSCEQEND